MVFEKIKKFSKNWIYTEDKVNRAKLPCNSTRICFFRDNWKKDKSTINKQKILSAVEIAGLAEHKNKRIGELSGRQEQRILIVKSLINDPKLLILDEPTTSIDKDTQDKFYSLIKKLNLEKKISIIWASHDLDTVHKLAKKVACINSKMFFHGDTPEIFENKELLKLYSESAMQAHMSSHSNQHKRNNNNV